MNRIGEENINSQGCMMKIIAYRSASDIDVQFNDEFNTIVKNKQYASFKKGSIKNPNNREIYGVGFSGQGQYSHKTDKNAYSVWHSMLMRCYDSKVQKRQPTYVDCTVCEEWHCFQIFAEWYYNNYYEVPEYKMNLDKDILIKNNKIYSPTTCVFAPQNINCLFTKRKANRGNLPIGVGYYKKTGKYKAVCSDGSKNQIYLGSYDTSEEAFEIYKEYKEQLIKDVAEEYKDLIPEVLYNAMYNYEVEIED